MGKSSIVKKIIICIVVVNLICNFVLAQSIIDITLNKETFKIGDELKIDAIISNPTRNTIYLQYLIMHFEREGPSISDIIKINPGIIGTINVYKTEINEDFKNGDYSIIIRLTDEIQNNIYDSKTLNFSVEELPEEFSFDINICKDSSCSEKSKTFVLNKIVYIDYESEVSEPVITAVLTYPDKSAKQVTLPASIKAGQIGTYELEVNASKQGYKTMTKREMFGVIEKEISIAPEFKPEMKSAVWLILAILGIIAVVLFIILYLYHKKH